MMRTLLASILGAASLIGSAAAEPVLQDSDLHALDGVANQVLAAPLGAPIVWRNGETGTSGSFVAIHEAVDGNGNVCRTYRYDWHTRGGTYGGGSVICQNAKQDAWIPQVNVAFDGWALPGHLLAQAPQATDAGELPET